MDPLHFLLVSVSAVLKPDVLAWCLHISILTQQFSKHCSWTLWAAWDSYRGGQIYSRIFPFHCVDICCDSAEAMIGKTADTLGQMAVAAIALVDILFFIFMTGRKQRNIKRIGLKNDLDEGATWFIKSLSFSTTCIFNIVWDVMGSTNKALLLHTEVHKIVPV